MSIFTQLANTFSAKKETPSFRPKLGYAGPSLDEVMNEHEGVAVKTEPYRYVVIDDFFTPDFYQKLVDDFRVILNRGFSETKVHDKFSRFPKYDAYGFTPDPKEYSAVNIMRTPEWKQYFAELFGRPLTNDEIMAYHHHLPGSASGWVHSDYSLCSFVENPLSNGINSWFYDCTYEDSSEDKQPGTKKVMRAITILYYLDTEGDGKFGGETGVYSTPDTLVEKVAPVNNRLFAFECSPHSFHAFQQNRTYPRNTITQWFHDEPERTFKKFNDRNYSPW